MEHLVVGVARFVLLLTGNRSLKEKRRVVHAIRDRLRARQGVTVAEIGAQDAHHRAVLAVALAGSDAAQVERTLQGLLDQVDGMHLAPVVDRQVRVETWGDSLAGMSGDLPDRW